MLKNKAIGYAKEAKVLGGIGNVSFLEGTVTLVDENEELHVVDIDEVIELAEIGKIGKVSVYRHDVLTSVEINRKYEIDLDTRGLAHLYLLDDKLERVKVGDSFEPATVSKFEGVLEVVGSIFELKNQKESIDFNMRIVRESKNGEITYFYVGNNVEEETVDLIKVIYIAHKIFEGEVYERITITHEEYLEDVASGVLKEVNPMELANYVTGVSYGHTPVNTDDFAGEFAEEEDDDEDDYDIFPDDIDDDEDDDFENTGFAPQDEDDDSCDECGEHEDDCDCDLW